MEAAQCVLESGEIDFSVEESQQGGHDGQFEEEAGGGGGFAGLVGVLHGRRRYTFTGQESTLKSGGDGHGVCVGWCFGLKPWGGGCSLLFSPFV